MSMEDKRFCATESAFSSGQNFKSDEILCTIKPFHLAVTEKGIGTTVKIINFLASCSDYLLLSYICKF